MRIQRSLCVLALVTALTGTSALPWAAAAPADGPPGAGDDSRVRVRRHLLELARSGAVGVQVRVTDRRGTWTARAGKAGTGGGAPVPAGGQFRAGSATKMFTAVTLLQLVGEGKVSLDAPLNRYLPPGLVPAAEKITVHMVLQHTSGLHDIAEDLPQKEELVRTRFRHYDKAALISEATSHPAAFPPGTGYKYSNTNYLIAGLIIERVTGHAYAEEVRNRIIKPLGLGDTSVPEDRTTIPGPHAHGYIKLGEPDDPSAAQRHVDITDLNPSMASSAGEIISSTRDLDTFLTALTKGKLLQPAEQKEMNRTVPTGSAGERYGLGLKHRRLSCGRTVLGHTGGIPGYATLAFTTPDRAHRVVLSANLADWPADPAIGDPIDGVLEDAVCG
ncbi:serine hydrolase domain-containing protein [Streptomyces sp. NPDC018045]|uniref:serine hydrolase domain-containing protein n=1 Tax=Streptomyces sp. NPDC018045 TaxID=3365037 RepID=UPI0037B36EBB